MSRRKVPGVYEAIHGLASLMPFGHLQADADPVGFLKAVADEITTLRADLTVAVNLIDDRTRPPRFDHLRRPGP